MSHALTIRKNGFTEMAYVGETPWHGLGQELQEGAPIEQWQQAAGMDWMIRRAKVRYATDLTGATEMMDDQLVLFRSDSKAALGIVSPKYKVVQPRDVLEFFRDLVDGNGYKLHTAGTMFGGRKFWALASIGESAVVVGEDKVDGFLLLSSSCDGTMPTTARFTTVRVVCNNTLSTALSGKAKREVTIRHTSRFDGESVKQQLGLARDNFGAFMKSARQLAGVSMGRERASEFVSTLLVDTKTVLGEDVRKSKQYQKIMDLFSSSAMGGTLAGAEGTAWGVVNAVTEFVDHHARASTASHRMDSAWFGRGDNLKTQALERALALA